MHALSLLSSYVKAARKVKDQPPLAVAGVIFGTFWDRQMGTRAGDDLSAGGVTLSTVAHSLPGTNPEVMIAQMISQSAVPTTYVLGRIGLFGIRGNASLNTIGFSGGTCASSPTLAFEIYSAVLHTVIR